VCQHRQKSWWSPDDAGHCDAQREHVAQKNFAMIRDVIFVDMEMILRHALLDAYAAPAREGEIDE
jgi:hypothetical protein